MITGTMTNGELAAAAFLIEQERARHPELEQWDRPGIVNTLKARMADVPAHDAVYAGLVAAASPEARTPAAIAFLRFRPTTTTGQPAEQQSREPACAHCGRSQSACHRAQENTGIDQHEYRPATAGARRDRAQDQRERTTP